MFSSLPHLRSNEVVRSLRLFAALAALLWTAGFAAAAESAPIVDASSSSASVPLWGDVPNGRPSCVRGIHLTAWVAGSNKGRQRFEPILAETEINTVVIDVKESEGDVYVPGVSLNGKPNFVNAIPDLKSYLAFLKARGIYTIARICTFHDEKIAHDAPDWAVHTSSPSSRAAAKGYRRDIWVDRKGSAWADAYNEHVWDYDIDIAMKAIDAGFQEIQFDYIRFPSDGPTKYCVYSKPHTSTTSVQALAGFLARAESRIKPRGVPISIDVFGLTGTDTGGMGIGQKLSVLLHDTDIVSPMMYPSHYYAGEYGLKNPNSAPYETVYRSLRDTQRVLALSQTHVQLRPWLQDFSLGVKYTPERVREQIEAAADRGVNEWILWNPSCHYTKEALAPFWKPAPAIAGPADQPAHAQAPTEPAEAAER